MSKPKLPSEMHPDFPCARLISSDPVPTYKYPDWEEYKAFYLNHTEFDGEGEYELLCPYCGNELQEEYNVCCGEAGHGEWKYVDADGNIKED